ncbi:MAG: 2Fe-2S iron-sulfur cluster-binding protein, partial [Fervidobacterium sp.]
MPIKIDENTQMTSGNKIRLTVKPNGTILEKLVTKGINIRADCGGKGICGKCRVIVKNPKGVSPLTNAEKNHLSERDIAAGLRLACQAKILQDMEIVVPRETLLVSRKIMLTGTPIRKIQIKPSIKKIRIVMPKPTLHDSKPD